MGPGTLPGDAPFWDDFRTLYPAAERFVYLNNASDQPYPRPVAQALHNFVETSCEGNPEDLYTPEVPRRLRRTFARWLGCSEDDLAFCSSTSDGLIKAVNAVAWRKGDDIVIPMNEFPSVSYPFKMAQQDGARLIFAGRPGAPVTEEEILASVTPGTRAVAFSWVSFCTGYKMDLAALSRDLKGRGVEFVFVDGMQGVGAWPPDLRDTDVDFFAFQVVKWIAAPSGIGALYVRPGLLDRLRNPCLSWYSVPCCEDLTLLTDTDLEPYASARRWDGGTPPWISMVGAQTYLDLLEPAGPEGVAVRLGHLLDDLRSRLESTGIPTVVSLSSSKRSSVVFLDLPDAAEAQRRLRDAGVLTAFRMGRVRVSPHVYNGPEDFDRLVKVLTGAA